MLDMIAEDQYITKRGLLEALEDFAETFTKSLTWGLTDSITTIFRDELDSKLTASENRLRSEIHGLRDGMEDMLDERTEIILQGMHDVVMPRQAKDDELDRRVGRLETKFT